VADVLIECLLRERRRRKGEGEITMTMMGMVTVLVVEVMEEGLALLLIGMLRKGWGADWAEHSTLAIMLMLKNCSIYLAYSFKLMNRR